MKLNSQTQLIGQHTILIPYEAHHVPKYHEWMKSVELQQLTASEPLSLEEEYKMQASWRSDEDKCTFIILDRTLYDENGNEVDAMIGDINIFIDNTDTTSGEIEIMIAETSARGKKFGWEAVIIMFLYGIEFINIKTYVAKISLTNTISIRMFMKLGFIEQSTSEKFQEITLQKMVTDNWKSWLHQQISWKVEPYIKKNQ